MSVCLVVQAQAAAPPTAIPAANGVLQRLCACGQHTSSGGECAGCKQERKGLLQRAAIISSPMHDVHEQEAERIAAQVVAAPAHCSAGIAPPRVQRWTGQVSGQMAVPNSVDQVLVTPGRPLEPALREDMEQRFGYDFTRVRVHSGPVAERSAREVNAHAYTVGNNIVMGPDHHAPTTSTGQKLLAHELTHVIQQAGGVPPGLLQRQGRPRPAPVDANAQRIINLAQDASQPIDRRAVAVVQAIINQYFPNDASKISRIVYREGEHGLHITYSGRGTGITGIVEVGRYFVENTTQAHFARRVSQVRHEIEHVEQQRAGMSGQSRQDEREFTAFYHEALFQEPAGAGRIQHSTRVSLIDAALGYFNCLSAGLQQANTTRRDELAARRIEEVRQSGHSDLGPPPTSCHRQSD